MPKVTDPALLSQLNGANPAGMTNLGDGFYQDTMGRKFRAGPQGGFTRVGGPTDTQIDEASKALKGSSVALAGIDRVDRQLKNTRTIGPFGWITNPTDLSVLEQSVKDLQLKLKEQPYNLGVLNGPDLDLLESIVANPGQLKSAAFRKTIAPRLANLASIVGQGYRSEADRFKGLGGNPNTMPPLYRSPDSHYTAQEWGNQGRVPPQAYQRNAFSAARATSPGADKRPPLSAIFGR